MPGEPLAITSATPQRPSASRRRGSIKCTSCARSKKRRYKVLIPVGTSLTISAKLILAHLTGHAWIAKPEVGRLTAIRYLVLPTQRRQSDRHPEMTEIEANYEKLRNDVDGLKGSLDNFKEIVSNLFIGLQHTLSTLLRDSNLPSFPTQSSFIHV